MTSFHLNDRPCTVDAHPAMPLLWVLRDRLGLLGTKYGCGVGVCGICKVLVDGVLQHACVMPMAALEGRRITTIEGIAPDHPVARAWVAEQVPQCGYCQPGQVVAATSLVDRGVAPDSEEARETLTGVLCRCGAYQRIGAALARAASGDPGDVPPAEPPPAPESPGVELGDWVRIATDGTVTVVINHAEMGQGVASGLATLVAEELGVEPHALRTGFAPAEDRYRNPRFGVQLTGGSTSIRGMWEPLRRAGARTRDRLIRAAAEAWEVAPDTCEARAGEVIHPSTGRSLGYGALAAAAAALPEREDVPLRSPGQWRLIGRSLPRLDIPAMVRGRIRYGMDVKLPGMRVATVLRCPVPGGRVREVDDARTRRFPGVREVVRLKDRVAVVADDTWSAWRGRLDLRVRWDEGANAGLDDARLRAGLEAGLEEDGKVARDDGDAPGVLAGAPRRLEAKYHTSLLAHATMEPMNCTARVGDGRCKIWLGTQAPEDSRDAAARVAGLAPEQVTVHSLNLGGGFGRRGDTDMVEEAVALAGRLGHPVQVVWTRDEDLQHDHFRPAHAARLAAALDADGAPLAWVQKTAGAGLALDGIEIPYAIPHVREARVVVPSPVPVGSWRAVGPGQNAFVVESFVDELAHAAARDPYRFRRDLLTHAPRHRRVLDEAAAAAGWAAPAANGRARGIAVYRAFGSWVAQVAEVSRQGDSVRVERVVCAIDCGTVVNPDQVRAQVEGAVAMGVSAALKEAVTLADGRVTQSTFGDYPILTFGEMPRVEVVIVDSDEPPGGVGEPGLLPVAPAVANAVYALTGQRLRQLPLRPDLR